MALFSLTSPPTLRPGVSAARGAPSRSGEAPRSPSPPSHARSPPPARPHPPRLSHDGRELSQQPVPVRRRERQRRGHDAHPRLVHLRVQVVHGQRRGLPVSASAPLRRWASARACWRVAACARRFSTRGDASSPPPTTSRQRAAHRRPPSSSPPRQYRQHSGVLGVSFALCSSSLPRARSRPPSPAASATSATTRRRATCPPSSTWATTPSPL